jgi:hypothetical protein
MFAMPNAGFESIRAHERSNSGSCGLYDSLYKIAISNCGLIPACCAYRRTCGAKWAGS